MQEQPKRPWRFPYETDPTPRLERDVYRPVVRVTVSGPSGQSTGLALVDSGSEHTLIAPWVAQAAGLVSDGTRRIPLGLGGERFDVEIIDAVQLELKPPLGEDDPSVTWTTEVGVPDHWLPPWPILLGQVGFFDEFTLTMNRAAQAMVVQAGTWFDDQFGIVYRQRPPSGGPFRV